MAQHKKAPPKIASTVAALVLILAFSYLALFIASPFLQAIRSRDWLKAEAIIVASYVSQDCAKNGGYTNKITYQYSVQGHQFEGHNEHFGISFCGHREEAQERAKAYVPGKSIQIRYDAQHPEESVVNTAKISAGSYLVAAFFICVLVALIAKAIPSLYRAE